MAPNVALFVAVFMGMSMARQCLQIKGLADVDPDVYAAELRHMINAALAFKV